MSATPPSGSDVPAGRRSVRELATGMWDPFHRPTMAVLGLGDLVGTTAVSTTREVALRMRHGVADAQTRVEELPVDLADLRTQLTGDELRRLLGSYRTAARWVYGDLVERGGSAYSQLQAQPSVRWAVAQLDGISTEMENRLEDAVERVRS